MRMFPKFLFAAAAAAALCVAATAAAREIADGKLQVRPTKDGKYKTDAAILGKAEFYGYAGDFAQDKKINGILLKDGAQATDEQKHIVAITAKTLGIDAVIELDGKQQPLVDPVPPAAAAPTPPPMDDTKPVAPAETH